MVFQNRPGAEAAFSHGAKLGAFELSLSWAANSAPAPAAGGAGAALDAGAAPFVPAAKEDEEMES